MPDQYARDVGRGGGGVGAEGPGADGGAVQQQRQLLPEAFRVGGTGLPGGLGQPRGDGLLVLAGQFARGMLGVGDLHGSVDKGAQGRRVVGERQRVLECREEPFAGSQVGAFEHLGHGVGVEPPQVLGDQLVLAGEVLVRGALGDLGHRAELVHPGVVDALLAEQLLRRGQDALSRPPAPAPAARSLPQLTHGLRVMPAFR